MEVEAKFHKQTNSARIRSPEPLYLDLSGNKITLCIDCRGAICFWKA